MLIYPSFPRPCRCVAAAGFCLLLGVSLQASSWAQTTASGVFATGNAVAPQISLERRVEEVSSALAETQRTLRESMLTMNRLQGELADLQAQMPRSETTSPAGVSAGEAIPGAAPTSSSTVPNLSSPQQGDIAGKEPATLARLAEEQEALEAEIRQHDQTKLETTSKYPVRVSGLVLFSAFANDGAVDNIDLPALALPRQNGAPNGSVGATARQSIFGVDARGPRLAGARSSAALSVDFFGDLSYSLYSSPNGTVRLRRAQVGLDWSRTTLEVGIQEPLISPLSPTSYATVAQPSLLWAGNLWTWAPQLRLEQRVPLGHGQLHLEGGLLDPLPVGVSSSEVARIPSPGELARQPALEGRVSWRGGEGERAFSFGAAGYSSQQRYSGAVNIHSWVGATDWSVPLPARLSLRGEAYRGRALGSLGGGAYKNVLTGTDPRTGLSRTEGVDAVGGWSQLTWHPTSAIEANGSFGLDDALASNFRSLQLPSSAGDPLQSSARNRMVVANLVFKPRTYLILSPEFRRIRTWRVGSETYDANIMTISAGYQF